ncbi:S8 family serine peptidase [Paenibacillus sp. 481]|uniref:S8 family serine peptidase n=1 Tax=Paenibacillus sp. 481 TaxID=2835869 RepID=UPI001E2C8975|nr:S8 family serine peptidase [Paenibacillus sp. 481]
MMKSKLSFVLSLVMALSLLSPVVSAQAGSQQPQASPERLLHLKSGSINLQDGLWGESFSEGEASEQPKLYVVQFKDVISESSKQVLIDHGAVIGEYLPDFAYLVTISPQQANLLASNNLIYNVTPYQAEWKGGSLLSTGVGEDPHGADPNRIYIISIFKGKESNVTAWLHAQNVTSLQVYEGAIEASFEEAIIPALLQHPDVTYIEPKAQDELFNDFVSAQVKASSPNGAWSKGFDGKGQVVAVADSGLDSGDLTTLHQDFEGQLHATPVANPTGTWHDLNGHGTHVAGTVLGTGKMSNGQYKGVAPGAKMVFQAIGCGGTSICAGDVRNLFGTAKSLGASIHTNSWGSRFNYSYNANSNRVDEYTFANKDFAVLFAAGNDGSRSNTISAPGNAKNTITVGNLLKSTPNQIASTSGRGFAIDGRIKPDVVATGSSIISARSSVSSTRPYADNANYTTMSGTSMATPAVAGAAAIVRQHFIEQKQVTPSAALIKATLINGAQDVGYGWMSRETGWGKVDLEHSLFPTNGRTVDFADYGTGLKTGDAVTFSVQAKSGQPLKISTVWNDYQGAVQATKLLVNDLDVEVVAPNGERFKGNCFAANTASSTCAVYDRINNVENVYLNNVQTGVYQVTVKAYNVPQQTQPFALVVSGQGANITSSTLGAESLPVSLKAPEQLSVTAQTYDSVTLGWSDTNVFNEANNPNSSDGNGTVQGIRYNIFNGATLVGSSVTASFTVTGLQPSIPYTFTVQTVDKAGNVSPLSQALQVQLTPAPTAPTKVWQPQQTYQVGDIVAFENALFTCVIGHTSLSGWEPTVVPALWSVVKK